MHIDDELQTSSRLHISRGPCVVSVWDSMHIDAEQADETPCMSCRFVCGIAKCSLAGLGSGAKLLELRANVMPFTTVRGAAGLEWNTRPGRYIEVSLEGNSVCVEGQ